MKKVELFDTRAAWQRLMSKQYWDLKVELIVSVSKLVVKKIGRTQYKSEVLKGGRSSRK